MDSLLDTSFTERFMSDPIYDGEEKEKSPVEDGNDYHLKSALRSHQDYIKNKYQKEHLRALRTVKNPPMAENPCKLLPIIWYYVISGLSIVGEASVKFLQETYHNEEASEEMIHLSTVELSQVLSQKDTKSLIDESLRLMGDIWDQGCVLGRLNIIRLGLTHLVINKNRGIKATEDPISIRVNDSTFSYYFGDSFVITCNPAWAIVSLDGSEHILNMQHVINVLDKITERYNMIVYNRLSSSTSLKSLYPEEDSLIDVISMGDDLVMSEGNEAYRGLSAFEAICVGEIISRGDSSVWDVSRFLRTMIDEVSSLGKNYEIWVEKLLDVLRNQNIQQLSCLHGIYRIWGHPVVDLEKGLEKLRSVALMDKQISPEFSRNTSNMFKETFFCNYYKKHKFYPPYTWIGSPATNYIRQNLMLDKEIDRHNIRYHLEDWSHVQCEKTFEIPATYSLASCIKDRAISPKRSELIQMIRERGTIMDQTSRRGVLKWLNSSMVPVREFLEGIDKSGLQTDDCIIGLYPKERELKNEARYFSLMSFTMRLYFTITEHLANDHLLEYFPMVTMSDSMLELQKKLDMLSRKQSTTREGTLYYVVNIDFRKWNQQMREEMTTDLFYDTDRLFGFTNLVGRTHEIFKKSYIYLSSGEYVPRLSHRGNLTYEKPYSWTNDPSGKEGLRQKYWTIMTACDLMFVARKHNMKVDLVGGGDNQVLIVEVNTDLTNPDGTMSEEGKNDCKQKMASFMRSLSAYMEEKGLPLKVEETWISPDLLMFFKMMYFNNVTLISPLKQASRVFPLSNDQVMTVGNMASTVSSAVTVLSSKDMQLGPAIMLGRFVVNDLSCMVVNNHPLSKGKERVRSMWSTHISVCHGGSRRRVAVRTGVKTVKNIFLSLTLHHKVMGGSAIISPLGMMMRGFPDPLCEHLTWISKISKEDHKYTVYGSMSINNKTPWSHLLEDPVSVNHDAPMHGLAVLRREAERALATATNYKNTDFLDLAHSCNKEMMEGLADSLCSGDTIDIRILHDIMGANLGGYFNSIASKVNKTSTVMRMNRTSEVVEIIAGQEAVCMSYLASFPTRDHDLHLTGCPTETARRYRHVSWGKNIIGITTPHPAAFLQYSDPDHVCDHNYVQVKTSASESIDPFIRGCYPVYQGSYTKEKFKPTEMAAAYGEEDLLSRAIHLMKLINWRYHPESQMAKVIRGLLASLTDAEPSLFYGMMEWISGDAEHRYQDMATKHGGVPNIAYSILSYVRANTSTFRKHSRGGKNETIHFQAIIIYTSMMSLFKSYGGIGHWHESCTSCITTTTRDPLFKVPKRISFPTLKHNMFAYVPAESVKFHYHDIKRIGMYEHLSSRAISITEMSDAEKLVAASSLLSAVIASCDTKDRTSDTVSSIVLWADYIRIDMLLPMVCLRLSVDHMMRRHEWTWPKPLISKKSIRLLEPFIMSSSGRSILNRLGLEVSELAQGDIALLRDVIYSSVSPSVYPRIVPNRVSPIWSNDVICAKIFESDHIISCFSCFNRGGEISAFDVCGDTRLEYLFKVCSITLPVLKGDLSQIPKAPEEHGHLEWDSTPVQIFEVMESNYPFVPFPKDGPITRSIPLGIQGVGAILDIISETKGRITVSTNTVGLAIWRTFHHTRDIKIYNEGGSSLDLVCDMNNLGVESSDEYMDSEMTDQLSDVIYDVPLPCQPGWWLVTSRDELNLLYDRCKTLQPFSILASGVRPLNRAICAVRLTSSGDERWGGLQSLYRSLEGRCQPYVSKIRSPISKTKTLSTAIALFHSHDGSYTAAIDHLIIMVRNLFWKNELYTKKGRELLYLVVVMELSRNPDYTSLALSLGRIRALEGPRRIRAQMNGKDNRPAARDVRDLKELFRDDGTRRGGIHSRLGFVLVI
ncbi:RNA-dependent RNA polymerase [Citrus leprosis virus N]|uniref:RNA-directed RNA polymerase n=1 Tax=Citrus leprosis virus N TaxID=1956177 RepID=A0A1S5VFG6_9RHAB|nr:RNA-dependent RNA polymerase [Citrus leprosis virus N]AQN78376.1 RNA-dependent RNA polymerase [Citrus leprosis virus N]